MNLESPENFSINSPVEHKELGDIKNGTMFTLQKRSG
jgi:hypothetical protein